MTLSLEVNGTDIMGKVRYSHPDSVVFRTAISRHACKVGMDLRASIRFECAEAGYTSRDFPGTRTMPFRSARSAAQGACLAALLSTEACEPRRETALKSDQPPVDESYRTLFIRTADVSA